MLTPGHRLVAVGASNLARMALALLDAQRAVVAGPVEMHAALGRGRSYGMPSRLLGRGLDGILASGLWAHLDGDRPTARADATTVLLMDVGNDLLYGAPVPHILAWTATALQRLADLGTRRVVVGLPIAAIRTLSRWRFLAVRSVLFPRSRLTLAQAIDQATAVHEGLADLAARTGATFHPLPAAWFGLDPVHVRRSRWQDAARSWLGTPTALVPPRLDTAWQRCRLLTLAPAERRWFGRTTRHAQPARCFADGSSLSLW